MTEPDIQISEGRSARKLLDNGGKCFVNKMGKLFTVDVWDWDAEPTSDPSYHAAYGTWDEAMADFETWKAWPDV